MPETTYLIGLGSNRCRKGPPRRVIADAVAALGSRNIKVVARSSIHLTRPLGPGIRNFANAAAAVRTKLDPPELLAECKELESRFGKRTGRRWGDRTLDLDLLLWSEGSWSGADVTLPHPALQDRTFVLAPLMEIAPDWRHPVSGRTIRQLFHHVQRNMPVDRKPNRP